MITRIVRFTRCTNPDVYVKIQSDLEDDEDFNRKVLYIKSLVCAEMGPFSFVRDQIPELTTEDYDALRNNLPFRLENMWAIICNISEELYGWEAEEVSPNFTVSDM